MNTPASKVTVIAPARLHMGFLDLSGTLRRHFGSIGVSLNEIHTQVSVRHGSSLLVEGDNVGRVMECAQNFCKQLNCPENLLISVEKAIPEHVGLGSGTQLSLAVGTAIAAYYRKSLSVRDIAVLMDRGKRSGIGIAVFEQGGFVLDGGRGKDSILPPLLSRISFPDDWRFILVFDNRGQGLHGEQEIDAFKKLKSFSRRDAEEIAYLLLMQALPALSEHSLESFGEVISEIQQRVGRHFAPVQGGTFTSDEVGLAMNWLEEQGAVGIGQTSWGPTGFCTVASQEVAENLIAELKKQDLPNLTFQIASARNTGGETLIQE